VKPIFALVDCNNFFVSCERVFNPGLEGKPTIVLSSNDSCIVARSNEAKAIGVPMGVPAFKIRDLLRQHTVTQLSANFELYGNISKRIIAILTHITPRTEVYSVDESFLDLSELHIADYEAWGQEVRARILHEVGVPVSIGIAPSKTLAKLGAEQAKKQPARNGVIDFVNMPPKEKAELLHQTPIKNIWGVGWKLEPKLRAEGFGTALQLAAMRPQLAQQLMGINGRQLVSELNGVSCHSLESLDRVTKSIMRSRTFGEDTNQAYILEAAIAAMATRASHALRTHGLLARHIGFFVDTDRHKPGFRRWNCDLTLDMPTNDTGHIISLLVAKLSDFYNPGHRYHRLGVYMDNFSPAFALQTDLLGYVDTVSHDRSQARMKAMDAINRKLGRGKIYFAAEDLSKSWQPKRGGQSPRYVSNWDELPVATIRS
jgi:DNA polymerase V